MEDFVPFGSRVWVLVFLVLATARAMDFISTWVATPNMVLEGNPIAKKLGWKYGIPVNILLAGLFAFGPVPAIVISTTSVLVAARNFQSAWLMRSLGEELYRDWHVARVREARSSLYILCLCAQTLLIAAVGAAILFFSDLNRQVIVPAIGLGIIAYAGAVFFFTMLSVVRLRRHSTPIQDSGSSPLRVWSD